LLNHGSGRTPEDLRRLGPYERNAEKLGPLFVRHGYVLLYLFRRGVGPSTDQGASAVDLMNRESATHGQEARNALQLELLEGREMTDALAAFKFLRALPEVNARNVGAIGDSFGGSLTVLMAEHEPELRAIVLFSAAGYSFDRSPELRRRLLSALPKITAPAFLFRGGDYALSSGKALDCGSGTQQATPSKDLPAHRARRATGTASSIWASAPGAIMLPFWTAVTKWRMTLMGLVPSGVSQLPARLPAVSACRRPPGASRGGTSLSRPVRSAIAAQTSSRRGHSFLPSWSRSSSRIRV
jgi:hypothetical protein